LKSFGGVKDVEFIPGNALDIMGEFAREIALEQLFGCFVGEAFDHRTNSNAKQQ